MNIIWDPQAIEARSMEIIEGHLQGYEFTPLQRAVAKRVVHTTGDPSIAADLRFSPGAAQAGWEVLRRGASVYTDVNMLKAGINSRIHTTGGQVFCSIAEPAVAAAARQWGITRAAASMRLWGQKLDGAVVAVGNAPTALFEVLDLIQRQIVQPALIVGTPVGFVGAAESKELLIAHQSVPYITVTGTRGGSPIAVSIINALLYYEGEVDHG